MLTLFDKRTHDDFTGMLVVEWMTAAMYRCRKPSYMICQDIEDAKNKTIRLLSMGTQTEADCRNSIIGACYYKVVANRNYYLISLFESINIYDYITHLALSKQLSDVPRDQLGTCAEISVDRNVVSYHTDTIRKLVDRLIIGVRDNVSIGGCIKHN